jgi:hypothetical protein
MDKQDAVDRGLFVFGESVSFSKAYPMVADLKVTVWIRTGGPMDGKPQERHFAIGNPPGEYIRCPKVGCTDGGWCIGDALRDMTDKRETHRKTGGICSGKQRMGRSTFRACLTHFTAEIELTYKPDEKKDAG